MATLSTWLGSIGFQTAGVNLVSGSVLNFTSAKKFLDAGYLLYTGINNWGMTSSIGGHSIVVESVDPATKNITVRDPADCSRKIYTINQATGGATGTSKPWTAAPLDWWYAIPIKSN
jgi:hypothetical protein